MWIIRCFVITLLLLVSGLTFAAPPGDGTGCDDGAPLCYLYSGGACSFNYGCKGADCLGKNEGDEISVVPGGIFPGLWLARSDGFMVPTQLACGLKDTRGLTLISIPDKHCGAVLYTEEHMYLELFASNPDTNCYGWLECICF